jgi:hypothetical protein
LRASSGRSAAAFGAPDPSDALAFKCGFSAIGFVPEGASRGAAGNGRTAAGLTRGATTTFGTGLGGTPLTADAGGAGITSRRKSVMSAGETTRVDPPMRSIDTKRNANSVSA